MTTQTLADAFAARGFTLQETGGGCTAYVRTDGDFEELVTLAGAPFAPESIDDEVDVSSFEGGDLLDVMGGHTVADCLRALAHPSDEYVTLALRLDNGFGVSDA